MGCTVQLICGVVDAERSARYDLGTQLVIGREHTMKPDEVEPGPWHEGGQALHKFQWSHHDVGGVVAVRAFELQYDITGAVELGLIADILGLPSRYSRNSCISPKDPRRNYEETICPKFIKT